MGTTATARSGDTVTSGSGSQRLRALEQANRVRLARAELKRRVAAEKAAAAEVILECPWEAASMAIGELLRCQRRWGAARCRRVLLSLELAENKPIAALTDRQRHLLAAVLRGGTAEAGRGGEARAPARLSAAGAGR